MGKRTGTAPLWTKVVVGEAFVARQTVVKDKKRFRSQEDLESWLRGWWKVRADMAYRQLVEEYEKLESKDAK